MRFCETDIGFAKKRQLLVRGDQLLLALEVLLGPDGISNLYHRDYSTEEQSCYQRSQRARKICAEYFGPYFCAHSDHYLEGVHGFLKMNGRRVSAVEFDVAIMIADLADGPHYETYRTFFEMFASGKLTKKELGWE